MKKFLEQAWKVIKALPPLILKTKKGQYLLTLLIVSLAKLFSVNLDVGDVLIIVAGLLGTLYGNETKEDFKDIYKKLYE